MKNEEYVQSIYITIDGRTEDLDGCVKANEDGSIKLVIPGLDIEMTSVSALRLGRELIRVALDEIDAAFAEADHGGPNE